jgi:hypothetical protein
MSVASQMSTRRAVSALTRATPDRRRHHRFHVELIGRFMRANKQECPCKLIDISVGGAAILAATAVEPGERIIAYFDHLGGLDGTVVRLINGGFAVKFNQTAHKREKLAGQITWLINRHELASAEDRLHERHQLGDRKAVLKLAEGVAIEVRLLDVSLSGASIGTVARPAVGSEVSIGKVRAKVMRHHENGIGVQFASVQDPESLKRYLE